jgi:hypothetical protein
MYPVLTVAAPTLQFVVIGSLPSQPNCEHVTAACAGAAVMIGVTATPAAIRIDRLLRFIVAP